MARDKPVAGAGFTFLSCLAASLFKEFLKSFSIPGEPPSLAYLIQKKSLRCNSVRRDHLVL